MNSKFSIQQIQKLKNFFVALKFGGLKTNINQVSSKATDGTTIDKQECLKLLRELPEFKGKEYENDNALVAKLSKELQTGLDRARLFKELSFTSKERDELLEALKDEGEPTETTEEQPASQTAQQGQAPTGGEQAGTMGSSGPGLPNLGGSAAAYQAKKPIIFRRAPLPPPTPHAPGLRDTPETGLDYEGKPYESDAGYVAPKEGKPTKTSQITRSPNGPITERSLERTAAEKAAPHAGIPGLRDTPETGLDYEGKPYESDAGYTAPKESATTETSQASKAASGAKTESTAASRAGRFQRPRVPAGLSNFGKNVTSRSSIFLSRNAVAIARTGLGGFAGGVLTGGNPIGMLAGATGGSTWNAWGPKAIRGGLDTLQRSQAAIRSKGLSAKIKKGVGKRAAVAFLILFLATSLFAITNGTGNAANGPTPTPGAGGGGGDIASCFFTRSAVASPIRSTTLQGWITSSANSQGVPAAVLASIAMHENQTLLTKNDSDPAIQSGQFCVDGPAVCVNRSTNATAHSGACTPSDPAGWQTATAKGLMQLLDIYNVGFPFCDIQANIQRGAEILKGKMGSGSWTNENDVKRAVCRFFGIDDTSCPYTPSSSFDYGAEAWRDLQSCRPATPTSGGSGGGAPGATFSCPVPNGRTSTHSYQVDPNNGHCSPGYPLEGICRTDCPGGISASRRAHAIDVPTHGQDVVLPNIDGQPVNWKFINFYSIDLVDGGGAGFTFEARTTTTGQPLSHVWTLDMLHMATTGLNLNGTYPTNTHVGQTLIDHVHFTIGKDIRDNMHPGSRTTVTDCDPGWLASDFACQ